MASRPAAGPPVKHEAAFMTPLSPFAAGSPAGVHTNLQQATRGPNVVALV